MIWLIIVPLLIVLLVVGYFVVAKFDKFVGENKKNKHNAVKKSKHNGNKKK